MTQPFRAADCPSHQIKARQETDDNPLGPQRVGAYCSVNRDIDVAVGHLVDCGPGSWQKAWTWSNVMPCDVPGLLKTSVDTCAASFKAHAI